MKNLFAICLALICLALPASAQFADQATFVPVGAGSANAQTITLPNATSLADVLGVVIKYIPAATNTGAATLTVNGFPATAFRKPTSSGLAALTGGLSPEIVTGQSIAVMYDGTYFVILSSVNDALTVTASSLANSAQGFNAPINLRLSATVATNALTISVTGNNASAASATNPVLIPFRDVNIGVGTDPDPTFVSLQSALNFTIGSTNTMGCVSATVCRLWVVAINNGGTLALCAFNALTASAPSVAALNEGILWTSASGTGGGSSAATLYCGVSAVTAKAIRILGYMEVTETVAGTWATLPTYIQLMGPGIKKPGDIVQTASFTTSATGTGGCTTGSFGSTAVTLNITPSSAANPIRYMAAGTINAGNNATNNTAQMFRVSTGIGAALVVQAPATNNVTTPVTIIGIDAPAVVTSTTYVVKCQSSGAASTYPNGGGIEILDEIMGALPANDNDADRRMFG